MYTQSHTVKHIVHIECKLNIFLYSPLAACTLQCDCLFTFCFVYPCWPLHTHTHPPERSDQRLCNLSNIFIVVCPSQRVDNILREKGSIHAGHSTHTPQRNLIRGCVISLIYLCIVVSPSHRANYLPGEKGNPSLKKY